MTIAVVIATYGDDDWRLLASDRALPSALHNQPDELLIHHEPDGSRASSLNNGAAQVHTDWIIFLDGDDELAPGYVDAMRAAADRHANGGVLLTPAVQQIRKGRPGHPFFFPESDLTRTNWLVIGTMIEREFFLTIGGFREHPHGLEDWNCWARAVRAGARVLKVPDAVYVAHVNPQSKHHVLMRDRPGYAVAYEHARADAWD